MSYSFAFWSSLSTGISSDCIPPYIPLGPYLTKCVNSWQSDETLESFPVIGLHTNRWPILIVTTSTYLSGETPII